MNQGFWILLGFPFEAKKTCADSQKLFISLPPPLKTIGRPILLSLA